MKLDLVHTLNVAENACIIRSFLKLSKKTVFFPYFLSDSGFTLVFQCSFSNVSQLKYWGTSVEEKELRGFSPQANYTDRSMSAKLVPTLVDRGCRVVSATDPHGR
jgi:hypothetical protein